MMFNRIVVLGVLSLVLNMSAHAGFMDMIGQAAQVANAVRGQPAATPAPTVAPPRTCGDGQCRNDARLCSDGLCRVAWP